MRALALLFVSITINLVTSSPALSRILPALLSQSLSQENSSHASTSLSTQAYSDDYWTVFSVPGPTWTDLQVHCVPKPHAGSAVHRLLDVCSDVVRQQIEHHGQYHPVPRNPQRKGSPREFSWVMAGIDIGIEILGRPSPYIMTWAHVRDAIYGLQEYLVDGREDSRVLFRIWTGNDDSWRAWGKLDLVENIQRPAVNGQ